MSAPFWHLGVVVGDLDGAMTELTRALGLHWSSPAELVWGEWTYRSTFSRQGPPYLELIEGPPASPWDGSQGSRIDHISYWVDDIASTRRQLEHQGVPVEFDGQAVGKRMNYHRAPLSGMRLEPLARSRMQALRDRYGLGGLER